MSEGGLTTLPLAHDPFEELQADGDTDAIMEEVQEIFEEVVLRIESSESGESAALAEDERSLPGRFEGLLGSAATHIRLLTPLEPFEELEASSGIKLRITALQEGFEELYVRRPCEELETSAGALIQVPTPLEPFEALQVGCHTKAGEVALQEIYEELVLPAIGAADQHGASSNVDANVRTVVGLFEELTASAKRFVPSKSFEELEVSLGTEGAVATLKEVFEDLAPFVGHGEGRQVKFETDSDDVEESFNATDPEAEEPETEETGAESPIDEDLSSIAAAVDAAVVPSLALVGAAPTGYYVGAPTALMGADGAVQQVTCRFNDLTLDDCASATVGDVFAEACGVRRPVTVSCVRHLAGRNWCVHLLNAGVAVRDCVVADVCAALECDAIRVRNVTLVATAAMDDEERSPGGETARDHLSDDASGAGMTIRFDVVHEAVLALHPQEEVLYLLHECKFPFLQQWCRSQVAMLCLERRQRHSAASKVALLHAGSTALSSQGVAIQLWAYATEAAPKRPSE
ncbi:hypothetical protein ABL78_8385 [Leptomonas seymouri]|uniref:Uncharacterized protein n=1 Tax=Leptomonas seymouri TaxID=5684 RepID=A0A0N1HYB1_LEPSE|nr:hypothetical protein ABL78_8385 [Leptomonas seymouri]|eukprot:KPI82605.1 hypothetical protein ABL78_8385 [Leptomonas seymouri]